MQTGIQDSFDSFAFDATLGRKTSQKLANICRHMVSSLHDEVFLHERDDGDCKRGIKLWGDEDSAIDVLKNITAILTKMSADSSRFNVNKLRGGVAAAPKTNKVRNVYNCGTGGAGGDSGSGGDFGGDFGEIDPLKDLSPVDIQMVMEFCESYKAERELK